MFGEIAATTSASSTGTTAWRARRKTLIYAADMNNWRVQKLVLHPEKARSTAAR